MSFLQGVTSFLESVDQKAGEIAEARRRALDEGAADDVDDDTQKSHAYHTQADEEEFELEEEEKEEHGKPLRSVPELSTSSTFPKAVNVPAVPLSAVTNSDDGQLVRSLLHAQHQLEQRHEAALQERQRAFDALERNYKAMQEYVRSMDEKLVIVSAQLDSSHKESRDLKQRVELMTEHRAHTETATNALRQELSLLQEELQQVTQERSMAAAEISSLKDARYRAEQALQNVHTEYTEYRRKSKLALEEKEATMAATNTTPRADADSVTSLRAALTECQGQLASMRQQVEAALDDNKALTNAKFGLETAVASLESERAVSREEIRRHHMEMTESEHAFQAERTAHAETRKALSTVNEELEAVKRQVTSLSQQQQASKGGKSTDALELRVREMAEMLMEKQAALEAKRSESDQWRTRFEVSQQRLREAELMQAAISGTAGGQSATAGGMRSATRAVLIEDDFHDSDVSKNKFMKDLSRRGAWGEKVVHVAQGLDRVSLSTGSVLRRHSLLRVGIIVYVLLLHCWVFFAVTLSSAMPSDSKHSMGPKM